MEVRETRRPAEGLRLEVHRREGELQTRGLQLRHVTILLCDTTERLRVDRADEVIATTAVGIDLSRDTALEEAEAEACTVGHRLLVGQVVVSEFTIRQSDFLRAGAPRDIGIDLLEGVGDGGVVRDKPDIGLQAHRGEGLQMTEEVLTITPPSQLHIPRREPADIARRTEAVAGVEAQQSVDGVAVVVGIAGAGEEAEVVIDLVADGVVVLPLLIEALDSVGEVVGVVAQVVEDTVVDIPVVLDVPLIELHTSSGEDVVLAEGLVIVEVELEAIHIVLYDAALTDTALGEYGVRKCVGVVGIGTQVLIVVAYVGRLHGTHATSQDGVLGVIEEGHRIGVLDVGDEGRTQLLEDIPRGSTLDTKITLSAGAAALTELVEDIVGDVVLRIALCGEQCAARRIGVLDC